MKFLKSTSLFLLVVIGITLLLSFLLPTQQHITRTITIRAPAHTVYEEVVRLENFNKWVPWIRSDSSTRPVITGNDGQVGTKSSWKGDPRLSGDGNITITSAEPDKKVVHDIQLTSPKKMNATSTITLTQVNDSTTVSWNFIMQTPRPWNIFNLFYHIEKYMGKDFDDGLSFLKKSIESKVQRP